MKSTDKEKKPNKAAATGREKIPLERDARASVLRLEPEDMEGVIDVSLRPSRIGEFVGQERLKENLHIALEAAKKRKEPLEHILFSGPPGLGKTSLAHIIAHEMGAKIVVTSGPAVKRAGDLVSMLTNLEKGDIIFIDEIHRLPKIVEEFVYPAMEDYRIDFTVGDTVKGAAKGAYTKTIPFLLQRFTLIGATTRQGLLSSPLRDRFGLSFHLDFYEPEDLRRIVERSAKILDIDIDPAAALELARCSRGTPRTANRLLRRVRDYAQVKSHSTISVEIVRQALKSHDIDENGLDALDRKVLRALVDLYAGGPAGVESLAATLNEEVDTLVDVVEPFLLKSGYLRRTSRGREATALVYEHLKLDPRSSRNPDLFNLKK